MAGPVIEIADADGEISPATALNRGRRAAITVACFTAAICSALLYDVLPPIIADVARHFGGGSTGSFIAQLASTVPLFGVMLAGLFTGPAIERFGLRQTLITAMLIFAVAGSSGALLDQPELFLLGRLLTGIAAGAMTTTCTSFIAVYFRGADRARMNGLVVSLGSLSAVSFVLVAGFIATWWWRSPFLLHGIATLAFVPAILLTGPVVKLPAQPRDPIGNLRRLRPMLPVCLIGGLWFVLMLMSAVQTPFVMAVAGIADHETIAVIYAMNAAAIALSSVVAGRLAPRLATANMLRFAFLLMAVAMCTIATGTTNPHFAIGLMMSGTSSGLALTAIWTWGMRIAPRDVVARSLGMMTTSLYLGGAISPFLTAPYEAMLGVRAQFYGVAATVAAIVAIAWVFRRRSSGLRSHG